MNSYHHVHEPTENAWSAQHGRSPALWSTVTDFFRRQPEFVLGGALVGGALLAYWVKNAGKSTAQAWDAEAPYSAGNRHPRPASQQADAQNGRRQERRRTWARSPEEPRRMPSARLGATEDQLEELATPSTHALESGNPGATGAAYDLDPKSITGG